MCSDEEDFTVQQDLNLNNPVSEKPWYEQLEEKHLTSLFEEGPPPQQYPRRRHKLAAHEANQDLFVQFTMQISENIDVCHQKLSNNSSDLSNAVTQAIGHARRNLCGRQDKERQVLKFAFDFVHAFLIADWNEGKAFSAAQSSQVRAETQSSQIRESVSDIISESTH